jgi:hypothetical protein
MHGSPKARTRVRPWVLASAALAAIVIVIIAYAWIDGGREALHPIAVPVSPEAPR